LFDVSFDTDLTDFYQEVRELEREIEDIPVKVMHVVGAVIVDWLKSTDPKFGHAAQLPGDTGPREQHPGGWADRTSRLSRGYRYKVIVRTGQYILRFSNNTEYAAFLDVHEGRFVLKGVADSSKAPAVRELEKALRIALPDWNVSLR
jgi:Bacteriophage HK97-gp10, putative tail-component